jgi:hypothetical protein
VAITGYSIDALPKTEARYSNKAVRTERAKILSVNDECAVTLQAHVGFLHAAPFASNNQIGRQMLAAGDCGIKWSQVLFRLSGSPQ